MTKNEKIAISVSAVVGFGIFCFVVVAVMSPLAFLIAYTFGNNTRFIAVDKEQLPYAMGEDFVFLSQQFFDERPDCVIDEHGISVRYGDKRWNEIDTTFAHPIPNAHEYGIVFNISNDERQDFNVYFSCRKTSNTFSYDDFSYGNYSYGIYEYYSSSGGELSFSCSVPADSGSSCELDVTFTASFDREEDSVKAEKFRTQCVEIFECMLDNLVGYAQCVK